MPYCHFLCQDKAFEQTKKAEARHTMTTFILYFSALVSKYFISFFLFLVDVPAGGLGQLGVGLAQMLR